MRVRTSRADFKHLAGSKVSWCSAGAPVKAMLCVPWFIFWSSTELDIYVLAHLVADLRQIPPAVNDLSMGHWIIPQDAACHFFIMSKPSNTCCTSCLPEAWAGHTRLPCLVKPQRAACMTVRGCCPLGEGGRLCVQLLTHSRVGRHIWKYLRMQRTACSAVLTLLLPVASATVRPCSAAA